MAFFLIERDQDSGALSIPISGSFPTREAALEALARAMQDGTAVVSGEIFVSDLGMAVPVLMMPTAPAAVAPAPESEEDQPDELIDLEEASGSDESPAVETVVYAAWADAVLDTEAAEGEDSLADALKRAATSLEAEGIVAPESIDFEELEDDAETESILEDEPLDADAEDDTDAEDAEDEPVEDELAEPAEAEALEPEPADDVEDVEDVEMSSMLIGGPSLGDDSYVPRPVIMGDYSDSAADAEEIAGEAFAPTEPHEPASVSEYTEVGDGEDLPPVEIPESILDPFSALAASESEVASEIVEESGDEEDAIAAAIAGLPVIDSGDGYEPAGELDLSQYTCDDCIYVNTCPKVGQATPAECGSFQWRAE